jgi:hypothetical protein
MSIFLTVPESHHVDALQVLGGEVGGGMELGGQKMDAFILFMYYWFPIY